MFHRLTTGFSAAAFAVALSTLMATQVMAATTWAEPTKIWAALPSGATHAFPGSTVTVGDSTIVASYVRVSSAGVDVFIRRSTDNGANWSDPVAISRPDTSSWRTAMAAYGNSIDAVVLETGGTSPGVRYSRSTDGGATFSASVKLTGTDQVYPAEVARGPDGLVAVVWYSMTKSKIFIRVSHDGGATFAPRKSLWKRGGYSGNYAVAVGDGVIYVATGSTGKGIQLKHSTDGGALWSAPVILAGYGDAGVGPRVTLSAAGQQAFLGYLKLNSKGPQAVYRRTADGGVTWAPKASIAPQYGNAAAPSFSIQDGVVHAVFGRNYCGTGPCDLAVFHSQSSDGVSWTARELVSPPGFAYPMGIGYTDRVVVGFGHYVAATVGATLEVVTGTE